MADAHPFPEPSRLPTDVKFVQVIGPDRATARRVASNFELGNAQQFIPVAKLDLSSNKDLASARWMRWNGRRWVVVDPTWWERLGCARIFRVFKRSFRKIRKGKNPFCVESIESLAAASIDRDAQHGLPVAIERGKQHVADLGNAREFSHLVGAGANQAGSNANSVFRAEDNQPFTPSNGHPEGDFSIVTGCNSTFVSGDNCQSKSPSGLCASPKVAEAGESESPLSGGGNANG